MRDDTLATLVEQHNLLKLKLLLMNTLMQMHTKKLKFPPPLLPKKKKNDDKYITAD